MPINARSLLRLAVPLTFAVIIAGAYTRLSDAGLGCPDWPGCYGQLIGVPDAETAAAHTPESPLDVRKARIEVGHRYIAGVLGLLLFTAAFLAARTKPIPRAPLLLAVLVVAQALLGMLTVTELLRPIIVSAHLMGGMLILATAVYALGARPLSQPPSRLLQTTAIAAAAVLAIQIFLGGWVSANYAALACPGFPHCADGWLPETMTWEGYAPGRDLHLDAAGAPLGHHALATIHWTHRAFAIAAFVTLGGLGALLWRTGAWTAAAALWTLLAAQTMLGAVNVLAGLPMWSALSHVGGAALLAATMAWILAMVFRAPDMSPDTR